MDYAPQTFKEPCRILPHFKNQMTKWTFRFALNVLQWTTFSECLLGHDIGWRRSMTSCALRPVPGKTGKKICIIFRLWLVGGSLWALWDTAQDRRTELREGKVLKDGLLWIMSLQRLRYMFIPKRKTEERYSHLLVMWLYDEPSNET